MGSGWVGEEGGRSRVGIRGSYEGCRWEGSCNVIIVTCSHPHHPTPSLSPPLLQPHSLPTPPPPQASRPLPSPPRRIPRNHVPLLPLFMRLIRRQQSCPYAALLNRHCKWEEATDGAWWDGVCVVRGVGMCVVMRDRHAEQSKLCIDGNPLSVLTNALTAPLTPSTPPTPPGPSPLPISSVAAFLWSALRWVVPSPLLGCPATRRALRLSLLRLLTKRRWERVALGDAARGVRERGLPWGQRRGNGWVRCKRGVVLIVGVRLG